MANDDFTDKELAKLFDERRRIKRPRLPRRTNPAAMARSDAPFLADVKDPAYIKRPGDKQVKRSKPIKYLTIKKSRRILAPVIKRKDDKMATNKKIQTNYMQTTAVCLLAAGAIIGLADMLGGGLAACFVAALLASVLFVLAVDYRK